MRVLLDENVDRRLRRSFDSGHDILTVVERGWSGKGNGELLDLAQKEFDAFVTTDKGIPHQQNLVRLTLTIVLLEARSNRYEDLVPLMGRVNAVLGEARAGELIRVR